MKTNFYLFILFIVLLISFLLFHDKGNAISKPYLEKLINKQLSEGEHVVVQQMSVDIDNIRATLLYNQTSTLEIKGTYSLLMQSFDLNYKLSLKDFKYKKIELKEQLDATGHASGSYDVSDGELNMIYDINISDLSKLQPITKQKLYGSMLLKGEVKQEDKEVIITGTTEDLEGELNFQLQNDHFTMQMDGLSVEKMMTMLRYPSVFKASLNGEAEYNLAAKKGLLISTLVDAQLLPNDFISMVKEFNGLDLSKEKFKESNLTATIEKERIEFDFLAENSKTLIKVSPAFIENEKIDAHYMVEVEDKDVGGKIKGDISNPNISIDSSKFIQREVNRAIDKHSDRLNDLGIGKKEQKKVKDFLNNLFQ